MNFVGIWINPFGGYLYFLKLNKYSIGRTHYPARYERSTFTKVHCHWCYEMWYWSNSTFSSQSPRFSSSKGPFSILSRVLLSACNNRWIFENWKKQETYFFNNDHKYKGLGFEYYLNLYSFPKENVLNYEKTPTYYKSIRAQSRIQAMNSTIKLVNIG